jgi:hypothetical protein
MFEALTRTEMVILGNKLVNGANRCVDIADGIYDYSQGAQMGTEWINTAREARELLRDINAAFIMS